MSRKATSSRLKRSTKTKRAGKAATVKKPKAASPARKSARATSTKRTATTKRPAATRATASTRKAAVKSSSTSSKTTKQLSPTEVLARAETDVTAAIETLNQQMNTALNTFTELASAQSGRGRAVVRTAPLDRATAAFQRLVAGVVDEQLAEMLPPLVDLRNEMARLGANGRTADAAFYQHCSQTLDHVLALAGAEFYEAREGEPFDPLIHTAVGEAYRIDLPAGTVAVALQPGFRSARGKVLVPAKVQVNRR